LCAALSADRVDRAGAENRAEEYLSKLFDLKILSFFAPPIPPIPPGYREPLMMSPPIPPGYREPLMMSPQSLTTSTRIETLPLLMHMHID
jgi:hypothetical protein